MLCHAVGSSSIGNSFMDSVLNKSIWVKLEIKSRLFVFLFFSLSPPHIYNTFLQLQYADKSLYFAYFWFFIISLEKVFLY